MPVYKIASPEIQDLELIGAFKNKKKIIIHWVASHNDIMLALKSA